MEPGPMSTRMIEQVLMEVQFPTCVSFTSNIGIIVI